MDTIRRVYDFLRTSGWLEPDGVERISFLAAGEYNANYLVDAQEGRYVLRVNHGSQLGLGNAQIAYEYTVLRAVEGSGVTPRVFRCEPQPEGLDGGVLLMEYLEGRPLDYRTDADLAAGIFARVHAEEPDPRLLVQADPVAAIAEESLGLIRRYPDHPMRAERERLLAYHDEVVRLGERTRELFADEPLAMVNTEVNSGNFIIASGRGWLVDWEKAVVSHRTQDLGHFLAPTTTLWKTDHRFDGAGRRAFLEAYAAAARDAGGEALDPERLDAQTRVMERTILLRALAWCFMAHHEYIMAGRALKNEQTFSVIRRYLEGMEWILTSVD